MFVFFAGTIFRLKGAIQCMSFLDCNGMIIPAITSGAWKEDKTTQKPQSQSQSTSNALILLYFITEAFVAYKHIGNCLQLKINFNLSALSFNPLPYMPIFGSSISAANKDMMSKVLTNGDTIL